MLADQKTSVHLRLKVENAFEGLFVKGRIPSLDGLRAFSIALVLLAHASGTRFAPSFVAFRRDAGNLGVRIFFVISGFLITTLLLKEHCNSGSISLKHFFIRRICRIFPPAYFYVTVSAVLVWNGLVNISYANFLHAATYTVNYDPHRPWHLMHLWSLGVEEQFYLIWPVTICVAGVRKAMWSAWTVLLLAPATRVAMWIFLPDTRWSIGTAFQTNADALAAGCLLAAIRPRLSHIESYQRFLRSRYFWALPLCAFAGASLLSPSESNQQVRLVSMAFGIPLTNVAIAVAIDRFVRYRSDFVGYLLNSTPLVFMGIISYSLYIWQELFLNRNSESLINSFPINIVFTFAAALFSYFLIERPFVRLRKRLELRMGRSAPILTVQSEQVGAVTMSR
jgi:peptidoglycan/LPS O-acetylase OafA/YrhL